ncbi:MAG: prepilin peptidase [Rhizobiaceae bacterium]
MLAAIILVIFPFCMAFAAISDMISMTIANRISIVLAVTFLLVAPMTGMDWSTYAWHLAAGALVLAVTFGFFAVGGMGGGDAKLLAATALWMGMSMSILFYLVYAALVGGALTVLILLYRKSALSVYTGHMLLLRNFADKDVGVPYGIALAIGGILAFPTTTLAQWAMANF